MTSFFDESAKRPSLRGTTERWMLAPCRNGCSRTCHVRPRAYYYYYYYDVLAPLYTANYLCEDAACPPAVTRQSFLVVIYERACSLG